MDRCVIRPFSKGNVSSPMGRVGMYKRTEILFQCAIKNFGLPVCFGMVRCAHAQLCTAQTKQFTPESTYKNWITVRNQAARDAMVLANHVHEKLGNLKCSEMSGKSAKMSIFRETINNYKDYRMTQGRR